MDDSVSGFDVQGETNGLIALQYGLEGTSRVLVRHGCCLLTVRVGACAHPQDKDGKVQASVPEALGYDTLEELIHDYNTIRKSFRDKCYKERRRLQASVARAAGTPAPPPPPAPTPAADEVTVVCRPGARRPGGAVWPCFAIAVEPWPRAPVHVDTCTAPGSPRP